MIGDELEAVAQLLRDNDISADVDPAKVNLPGVWVQVGLISPDMLGGGGTVQIWLSLIARETLYSEVLTALDGLLGDVLDLVDSEGDIVTESVVMPDSPQPLPAYRVTVLANYERE